MTQKDTLRLPHTAPFRRLTPFALRTLTIVVALVVLVLCTLAVWHWAFAHHLEQQVLNARQHLHLHAQSLEQLIGRYRALPLVLALDPELRAALESDINADTRQHLNQRLERANRDTRASTLTLIPAEMHSPSPSSAHWA